MDVWRGTGAHRRRIFAGPSASIGPGAFDAVEAFWSGECARLLITPYYGRLASAAPSTVSRGLPDGEDLSVGDAIVGQVKIAAASVGRGEVASIKARSS